MRIAVFTDSFHPELGGIQDAVACLAGSLGTRGHRVLIVAPRPASGDYRIAGLPAVEPDLGPGVEILRCPALPLPGSTGQSRLMAPLLPWLPGAWQRLEAFEPDLVHVHTFLEAGRSGLRFARRHRLPAIGTNHWAVGGFALYGSRWGLTGSADVVARAVSRFYDSCTVVTAPSTAVAVEMRAAGLSRPVCVVSNPIDAATFHPAEPAERATLRARLGLTGPTAVYAGRLAIEKRIDVLIRAFARASARHPTALLVLAGHGTARDDLGRVAASAGATDRVRFAGSLSAADLARLFQAADVFATASTSESQCMALLQAKCCSLPAVVVRSRALPESLGLGCGLIAEPDDPEDLARQLHRLLDSAALRRSFGEAARGSVAPFTVGPVTDQWEALYETTIDDNAGRAAIPASGSEPYHAVPAR